MDHKLNSYHGTVMLNYI